MYTEREAFVSARSGHFQSMMHGYGPGPIPFSIARKYFSIATDRANAYIARGVWKKPTTIQVWYNPKTS